MISPWQSPLPIGEHQNSPVVIYFYSDQWVPMIFSRLAEAIALHRQILDNSGKEIFIFLSHLDPRDSYTLTSNNSSESGIYRFALESQNAENTLMHPTQRRMSNKSL